jgi:SAM-dependent methyltransferase
MRIKLGCPKYCKGYTCVDLYPKDFGVVKDDAIHYLSTLNDNSVEYIEAKMLLEHLPNPYSLIELAYQKLKKGGILYFTTDNAWFLPHYITTPLHRILGSHSDEKYKYTFCKGAVTNHYAIFTKLHLKNMLELAGFEKFEIKYILFFSRIRVIAKK